MRRSVRCRQQWPGRACEVAPRLRCAKGAFAPLQRDTNTLADMGNLDCRRHAIEQCGLMAPVELIDFSGRQRSGTNAKTALTERSWSQVRAWRRTASSPSNCPAGPYRETHLSLRHRPRRPWEERIWQLTCNGCRPPMLETRCSFDAAGLRAGADNG